MEILLGAVVLAAVLLIVVGRGRRGRRALAGAGVTVLVFIAAAVVWWLVLFLGVVRLDRSCPSSGTRPPRARSGRCCSGAAGVLAALTAAFAGAGAPFT